MPAVPSPADATANPPAPGRRAQPLLLIVDDQKVNIQYLYQSLKADYQVVVALQGQQAIDLCERQLPDLVLLDVEMPGMDGYEVCSRLKSNPVTSNIPVIFVSAHSDEASEARGLALGAVDFISKPVNINRVRARINNHLTLKTQGDRLRQLSQATDQSPGMVLITDLSARIEYVNDAFVRTTGYSRDDVLGQNPRLLQSGKTPPGTYESMWRALGAGEVWTGQFHNRRKDGSEFIEVAIIAPMRQPNGLVTHYVATKQDITERLRQQEELDRHRHHLEDMVAQRTKELLVAKEMADAANRAKSAFLANMSHEIRTPMNAILGFAHLMQRDQARERADPRLDKISSAGRHLMKVINDILDFSKIEAGHLTLDISRFDLGELLGQVAAMIGDAAHAKGLVVSLTFEGVPRLLLGDAGRLRQSLLNYANNAVKFTSHGSISLAARLIKEDADGLLVRFEVTDTGVGITAQAKSQLFRPFEQADNSTTRNYGGTGLGLAITRRLATFMGGEADADSTPGAGSTFWFTARLHRGTADLPLALSAEDESTRTESLLRRDHAQARLLVVDDDPFNREIATEMLQSVGLQADTACNGREAVDKVRDGDYTMVLMDVQMPVMGGLEATRLIRALPGWGDRPILAMTANVVAEDLRYCEAAGMNTVVTKPIDPRALYAALLKWLPQRGARQHTPTPTGNPHHD